MKNVRFAFSGAIASAFLWVLPAQAQTPAHVSIVSGNGQLVCTTCTNFTYAFFEPLIVKVTDANGNPVPNATVTWAVTTGSGVIGGTTTTGTSTSAAADPCSAVGQSCNSFSPGTASTAPTLNTITASAGSASATFYETVAPATNVSVISTLTSPALGTVLSGPAGSQSSTPVTVTVTSNGQPVPNISVRLVSSAAGTGGPTISCVTGTGADPGSVLTDATGTATCTPVFGGTPGDAAYNALVGGVASASVNGTGPLGYFLIPQPIRITVTQAASTTIQVISGNNQTAAAGQALTNPLVVQVNSGGTAAAGQTVTWTVSPASAATLGNASTTTGTNGQSSNTVTLSSTATGTVQVTATSGGNSVMFAVTVTSTTVTITSVTKVSGDQQTAIVGTPFANNLVVQVNTASGAAASVPVTFAVSGPATLTSAASVSTGSNGQAQAVVTAGSTPGTVTVTATAGSVSTSFTLTVVPQGPPITASSFLNGAGFYSSSDQNHTALSPCSIGVLANATSVPAAPAAPYLFASPALSSANANVSIGFAGVTAPAPIYSVSSDKSLIAFQVPCEVAPGATVQVNVNVAGATKQVTIPVGSASPGIFEFVDADGVRRAVLIRPDGSFVTAANPARKGENIRMLATGIGQVQPAVPTAGVPQSAVDSLAVGQIIVGVNSRGAQFISARRAPDLVGVDEVTFQVPSDAPTGNNVVLSLAVNALGCSSSGNCTQFSNGSKIPIQ